MGKHSAINEAIGATVKAMREQNGLTQQQLADCLGITRPSITNMESGYQPISIEYLYTIASCLNMDVHDLLPDSQAAIELIAIKREYLMRLEKWRSNHAPNSNENESEADE